MISLLAGRESARRSEPPPSRHDLSKKKCTLDDNFPLSRFPQLCPPALGPESNKEAAEGEQDQELPLRGQTTAGPTRAQSRRCSLMCAAWPHGRL